MAEKSTQSIPEGMHTVTACLWFSGNCDKAIEFYRQAFGAELIGPISESPDGKRILHAMLRFGNSPVMLSDSFPGTWEQGPDTSSTAGLWLYVEDCDALFNRAVAAGCKVIMPMMDAFWGDRFGKIKDPFGHTWAIASQRWIMSEEEVKAGQAEFFKTFDKQ
jgi:PhnB protein